MRETVDLSSNSELEKFAGVITDTFISSLSAITSRAVNLSISEVFKGNGDSVFEGYDDETLASAKEEESGYESGLLYRTRDITMLADYMLAGDGESKDEIDDDTKDAVQEMTTQLLSSLNVPLEGAFEKKFSFKVNDILKNMSSSLYQSQEYIVLDLSGDVDGIILNFRFFADYGLLDRLASEESNENVLDDGGIEALLGGSFFDESDDKDGGSGSSPKNLDLLLDIDIPISVRMGSAKLFLKDILGLGPGNIVELEQNADEPIELAINDKVIARGEVVIVDGYFGFRIKEIVSKAERIRKLKD